MYFDPHAIGKRLSALMFACVVGCGTTEFVPAPPASLDPTALVPVSGVVTINGKPMETVVVTFLPPEGSALATAETDKDGKYELASLGGPGALPGQYKIAISYLVSSDGEPQGRQERSSMIQGPGMLTAKEQLPPEYADLSRSKLSGTVGPRGGQFDFDVPATLAILPKPSPETKTDAAKPTETKPAAKSDDTKPADEPKTASPK